MKRAVFFTGITVINAEAPEVDVNLPDEELFEAVLHEMAMQWSSSGNKPNFKKAMSRDGRVARYNGKVCVSGAGWSVCYTTENFDKVNKELLDQERYVEAMTMLGKPQIWEKQAA